MRRRLRRIAGTVLAIAAGLVALAVLAVYLSDPKIRDHGPFARRHAGADVFTFDRIPHGRTLSDDEIDGYATRLLAEMTLEEKVHQMSGDSWYPDLAVLVWSKKYNDTAIPSGENRRLAIPPILFSDGPNGVVMGHSTAFPVAMARAASWDRQVQRLVGRAIGEELRAGGANFYGGVCINLLRHPGWGRALETLGEDPFLVGEMAAPMVEAIQRHNVIACIKHYALNSIEEDRQTIDVRADERTLREVYLPQYLRAIEAGAWAVMSSYNRVNGDYASENRWLLTDVLRTDWNFQGIVMSDFFSGVHETAAAALAGLDIEMPLPLVFGRPLMAAVRAGTVPESVIDAAVQRILATKVRFFTRPDPEPYAPSQVASPEHRALAQAVAEQSLVLLKNDGPVLPLDPASLHTVLVVGRLGDTVNLGDHGSSRVYPPTGSSPLAGLRDVLGAGVHVAWDDGSDRMRAAAAARAAEAVVIVAGLDWHDEGEYIPQLGLGGDRRALDLHPQDVALIHAVALANARTIVVLEGSSAITMEAWRSEVPAILHAFYPGMEGGRAIARILVGQVNPSGKLPFTIPADPWWLPPFTPGAPTAEYDYYHGYTLAEKVGVTPAFPFGFGLSYTTFSYAGLHAAVTADGMVACTVDVTNTGRRPGAEVVELYVGFPRSPVDRPLKLLRGFEKLMLQPGETRTVRFDVPVGRLGYWDTTAHAWAINPAYDIYVGGSSRTTDLLEASVTVE